MGLLVLKPKDKSDMKKKILAKLLNHEIVYCIQKGKKDKVLAQMINIQISQRKLTFIYSRQSPNIEETNIICEKIENSSYIVGDINLDPNKESDARKLTSLCGKERKLHLRDVTTIGKFLSQLDHIIVRNSIK